MRYVLLVIVASVFIAHHLPVAALNAEVARRARMDADTEAQVATYKVNHDSARLLKLYR
tara:strand:+ start:1765 stop:1941 length:177 start_codon:yes stop_codon:yes gene_type:complete